MGEGDGSIEKLHSQREFHEIDNEQLPTRTPSLKRTISPPSYEIIYPLRSSQKYSLLESTTSSMARTRSKVKKVRFATTSVSKIKFSSKAVEILQKQLAAQSERDHASHRVKHVGNWVRNIRDDYEQAHPVDDSSADSDDTLIPLKDEKKTPKDNYRIGKFRHFVRRSGPNVLV